MTMNAINEFFHDNRNEVNCEAKSLHRKLYAKNNIICIIFEYLHRVWIKDSLKGLQIG